MILIAILQLLLHRITLWNRIPYNPQEIMQ